jgi:urease accessory protein
MKRVVGLLIVTAAPAQAHGTLPGGGGFYAGAMHPFASLDHFVALVTIGLILSQRDLRAGLGLLVAGAIAGLALPFAEVTFAAAAIPMLGMAAVSGASIALGWQMPVWAALGIALGGGLCIGLLTDVPIGAVQAAITAGAGVVLAVVLIATYAMGIGMIMRDRFRGIPMRVVGSWTMAISLMMLAFLLRDMFEVAA